MSKRARYNHYPSINNHQKWFFLIILSKTSHLDASSSGELFLKSQAIVNTPEGKGPRADR